jgi:hypothetical protein
MENQNAVLVVEQTTAENGLIVVKIGDLEVTPATLFGADGSTLKQALEIIDKQARDFTPDITTNAGRDALRSHAFLVTRTKTTLEKIGKARAAEAKALPKIIDRDRRVADEYLTNLIAEVRQPLTDWEVVEKARVEAEELALQIEAAHAEALEIEALYAREREVSRKEAEWARVEEENRKIENERILREFAEKTAKEQAEREEQMKAEAAETARREAEEKAAREIADAKAREEQAEKDRLAAVESARVAAEKAEADRIAAEKKAEADKVQAVKDAEERAAVAAKLERDQKEAAETAARIAAEKKAANVKHRNKIESEALRFIVGIHGITEDQAKGVIENISAGAVPHITITY